MSDYKHKELTGSLFKNDKREKDSYPHAKGSALIDGVEYWVAAWTNDGKNGKYQSLKFERKDKQYSAKQEQQVEREAGKPSGGERPQAPDFDDDLPF